LKIFGLESKKIKELISSGDVSFSIYGAGKLGLAVASVLANIGAKVMAVDINPDIVQMINRGENPLQREPGVLSHSFLHENTSS